MFECSLLDENHAYDVIREIFSGGERQVQNIFDFSDIGNQSDNQNGIPYGKFLFIQEIIKRSKRKHHYPFYKSPMACRYLKRKNQS